ncbi:DUF151 domain-containing protein [Candidatus Kapabacteria bacterium]|nr:DUF151 domain-containing protein [Candidatus Kapabacteria bacterium]
MEKIELSVLGLSASPTGNNAYALILKEIDGNRRMPIIIGAFEAQAIALEMEGVMPPRPMTHDLFKAYIDMNDNKLEQVLINDLVDGTFFAKLVFTENELDARPSDAIAMAVRFNTPIFVNENIIEEIGITPNPDIKDAFETQNMNYMGKTNSPENKVDKLQVDLDKAIGEEDYEKAAQIRDEIKKILENSEN